MAQVKILMAITAAMCDAADEAGDWQMRDQLSRMMTIQKEKLDGLRMALKQIVRRSK